MIALAWCFLGVALIADVFMGAIEHITSKRVRKFNAKTGRYVTETGERIPLIAARRLVTRRAPCSIVSSWSMRPAAWLGHPRPVMPIWRRWARGAVAAGLPAAALTPHQRRDLARVDVLVAYAQRLGAAMRFDVTRPQAEAVGGGWAVDEASSALARAVTAAAVVRAAMTRWPRSR